MEGGPLMATDWTARARECVDAHESERNCPYVVEHTVFGYSCLVDRIAALAAEAFAAGLVDGVRDAMLAAKDAHDAGHAAGVREERERHMTLAAGGAVVRHDGGPMTPPLRARRGDV
jgi:hypothetical protein